GVRRGEQNKRSGVIERGVGLHGQRRTSVEIVPVAKDRPQYLRDRSSRCDAADKLFIDVKAFEATVHALGHAGIGMAVRKKRAVFEITVRHALPSRSRRLSNPCNL